MAKRATPKPGGTKKAAPRKSTGRMSSAKPKAAPRKTAKKPTGASTRGAASRGGTQTSPGDMLVKLIESPLVADLLAIGATAALAAIASEKFGRQREEGQRSKRMLKTAGKAAAAAMGRRLSEEVSEIRKASNKAKGGG